MKYRMKDLENFAATASCSTMGEASRKLGISQPALSESIQRLESDLGSAVFYRSRSGIQLTPRGRLFFSKVNDLLYTVKDLEAEEGSQTVFGQQSMSLGCHITVASYTLPLALSKLKTTAPDFKVELKHDLSRNIQTEVQRGRIDLGVVINPVQVPDLVISKLSIDTVAVWCSENRKSDEDTLIYNPHLFQSQAIIKKWKGRPQKTIETDGLELICRLTAQGLGQGIIPARAVKLSKERLKPLTSLPTYKDEIALIHRPEFGKAKAERLLLEAIRSAF
ncbi:MAG: LysR family transcriptional regulator [Bdellovibrionaceae bacterium]|nr:LysR family transcriptional regulator [Pseudobdellovibrionaceae bacterium]